MDVNDIVTTIASGSLRSYTWVAVQLGWGRESARAAGQAIARETLRRWPTTVAEGQAPDLISFPWWRVVGINGEVRTIAEDHAWFSRQVERLQHEGHALIGNGLGDLRVHPLPDAFE